MVRFASTGAIVVWAVSLAFGFGAMARFEETPGPSGPTPTRWPVDSALPRPTDRAALVMFVHPRCPCTTASLHELERLLVHIQDLDTFVVVIDDGPSQNRAAAGAIPDVQVVIDPAGQEAARFGSLTSGQVVVYGPDGALLFAGGITAGRGHEGDNLGSEAALKAALTRPTSPTAPVFGCTLADPP